jgi:lysophospholipase L1-like esterase
LARELGAAARVIEEGQNGRTTVHDDPTAWAPRNARTYLPACLESQKPLDMVVLMLGTNDLKSMFGVSPGEIAAGLGILLRIILQSECGPNGVAPKVLLVCPPAIGDLSALPELEAKLADGREKSLRLPTYLSAISKQYKVDFLNSQEIVIPSKTDGIHLDAREHLALGRAIGAQVKKILSLPSGALRTPGFPGAPQDA